MCMLKDQVKCGRAAGWGFSQRFYHIFGNFGSTRFLFPTHLHRLAQNTIEDKEWYIGTNRGEFLIVV